MSSHRHDVPLVLLHGFLGCKDDWHDVAQRLQTGRRIAVFDLPGHGPAADAREDDDCSIESACHRIHAVLEALEAPRAHVVGYSLGARAALHFAVTSPASVASLVLESGSAGLEGDAERQARRGEDEGRALALVRDGLPAFVDEWEKMPLFASQSSLPPDVRAAQRARRLKGDPEALARSLRHAGLGTWPWLGGHLGRVPARTLLVTGSLDTKFTAIARDMQRAMPNARHAVVDGAGHNVHLEKPDAFVELLDAFLGDPVPDHVH